MNTYTNALRMTKADYERLQAAINSYLEQHPEFTHQAMTQLYIDAGSDYRPSLMAYRWEVYHRINEPTHYQLSKELYEYLNDDHIDSALRRIFGHTK